MTIRHIDKGGIPFKHATVSQAATTFYVRSTGNDTNDGLTTGTALLTIQEAVNRIPDVVENAVTVDIGTGSFATFVIGHKSLSYAGSINITGAMKTATLATGTATGTSTGGDTRTLIHTGQIWTTNDLKGKWVYVNSTLYLIASNTSDTLTLVGTAGATMSGKAYIIQDNDTTITGGNIKVVGIQGGDSGFTIQKLKLSTGANYGIYAEHLGTAFQPKYLYMENMTSCGIYVWFVDWMYMTEVYAKNCQQGFLIKDSPFAGGVAMSEGSTYAGFSFSGGKVSALTGIFNGSTNGNGMQISSATYGLISGCSCSNNAKSGIYLGVVTIAAYGSLSGSGNGEWGITLDQGSTLTFPTGNTITGTLGDLTVDASTPITWASFSNIGDVAINPNKFSRAERTA